MSEVFCYSYIRSNQKIFIRFKWNVKSTLNLLTYQILNLQCESYKTGIQAGPTIHTFLFSYFPLHFHENALLLSSLFARRLVGCNKIIKKISPACFARSDFSIIKFLFWKNDHSISHFEIFSCKNHSVFG